MLIRPEVLLAADIADGIEDGIVNLDSRAARQLLPANADTYDGVADGRVVVPTYFPSPAAFVAAPTRTTPSAELVRAYDQKMARMHVHQPNMGRHNCVAAAALSALKAAHMVRHDTTIEVFVDRLAKLGIKARVMTTGVDLQAFNRANISQDPEIGTGRPNKKLIDIDHDTMIARLKRGETIIAWTDYRYEDGEVLQRGHLVTLYRNPFSGKIMCLDPLYNTGSSPWPITLDGTSEFHDRDIRIAQRQRYMALQ